MPTKPDFIRGADEVVNRFGKWPSFHDSEVLSLSLDRRRERPSAELLLHVWDMTSELDDRGYYVLRCHTLIRLRLEGVWESELEGFNEQNSLFDLRFEQFESRGLPCIRVLMDSGYGLAGSFACTEVAVVEVTPCDANGCTSAI
jgi:hypothetical protein